MAIWKSLCVSGLLLCAGTVHAAGLRSLEVPADTAGPAMKVLQWSPCDRAPGEVKLGPFVLNAVRDCPVKGGKHPLIVLSHGYGGTYLSHRDTAAALADAGFIVAALNHPDDNALTFDPARANSLTALVDRPEDIRRLIDFMLTEAPDATMIDRQKIGFFGFSRGGYTGLVLAGAEPDFKAMRTHCDDPTGKSCALVDPAQAPTGPWVHDQRIKAFVIADPLASVFPSARTLSGISAPVQLWRSQEGGDGVSPKEVDAIAANLPAGTVFHVVPGSRHFAFLAVCPEAMRASLSEICTDPNGFDRAAFHERLNSAVSAFFQEHLQPSGNR